MVKFCDICSKLLVIDTTPTTCRFICTNCNDRVTELTDEDTLLYERNIGQEIYKYGSILRNAGKDQLNKRVELKCSKCSHAYSRQVRIGEDLRLINVCESCDNQVDDNFDDTFRQ